MKGIHVLLILLQLTVTDAAIFVLPISDAVADLFGLTNLENFDHRSFDRESELPSSNHLTDAASLCLLSSKDNGTTTLESVCNEAYTRDTILQAFRQSRSRKIVNVNCGGDKKVGETEDEYNVEIKRRCVCLDLQAYNNITARTTSDMMISSYNPGCVNHSLTLTRDYFRGQKDLKVLALAYLPIVSILPNTFDDLSSLQFVSLAFNAFGNADLPDGLFCKNIMLEKLHLQGETFTEYPTHLFNCTQVNSQDSCLPELTKVILQNTAITSLPKGLFGCARNIMTLLLPNNRLKDVSNLCDDKPKALKRLEMPHNQLFNLCTDGLKSLERLELQHNYFSTLKPLMFRDLLLLEYLDVSHNLFKTIKSNWFLGAVSLKILLLNNNQISTIDGSLASLPLTHFSLGYNALTTFPANVINGSRSLVWLDLQANNLHDLANDSLGGLTNLTSFNASANNFTSVAMMAKAFPQPIISLTHLYLHDNSIEHLGQYEFQHFPGVRMLVLARNLIKKIHPLAFSKGLQHLVSLQLGNNSIRSVEKEAFKDLKQLRLLGLENNNISLITIPPRLESLNLLGNRLTDVPCMPYRNNLTDILLDSNDISSINKTSFCNIEKLAFLSLEDNNLKYLEPGAFSTASSLKTLFLSRNQLNLNFSVNYFEGTSLNYLKMSANRIESVRQLFLHEELCNVKYIYLGFNPITDIPKSSCMNMKTEILDFTGSNITTLHKDSFAFFFSLKKITLASNLIRVFPNLDLVLDVFSLSIDLSDNPVECSCKMKWLRNNETLQVFYHFKYCVHPVNQSLVIFKEVPADQFVCQTDYICDNNLCSCFSENTGYSPTIANCSMRHSSKMPKVLPRTAKLIYLHGNNYNEIKLKSTYPVSSFRARVLTLHDCNITKIEQNAFMKFRSLTELYLHNNHIQFLPKGIFRPLSSLKIVTLNNNLLMSLNNDLLLQNNILQDLRLHNNNLRVIPEQTRQIIADMFHLRSLTLHNNPWTCKCDNMTWKSWLSKLNAEQKLISIDDIKCDAGTSVFTTPDDVFLCPLPSHSIILAAGIAAALPLALLITMVMTFYNRHILAVLIFSTFGVRLCRQKDAEGYQYDAILLYDDECTDDDYLRVMSAVKHLYKWMTGLTPPYKVMLPMMDIDCGASWTNEISNGVYSSHKTVIFLSKEFLMKEKTMFLFDMSYNLTMERRSSDLILILDNHETLTYMKSKELTDQRLKAFLRTNNYLLFCTKHFHKKLLYLLPGNFKRNQNAEDQNINLTDFNNTTSPEDL